MVSMDVNSSPIRFPNPAVMFLRWGYLDQHGAYSILVNDHKHRLNCKHGKRGELHLVSLSMGEYGEYGRQFFSNPVSKPSGYVS